MAFSLNEKEKKDADRQRFDFETKQSLLGFFELLLKIDMRNYPERYKKPKEEKKYD